MNTFSNSLGAIHETTPFEEIPKFQHICIVTNFPLMCQFNYKVSRQIYIFIYTQTHGNAGILRDKTMGNKLIYIPNDNKQITYHFCKSKFTIEKLKTTK